MQCMFNSFFEPGLGCTRVQGIGFKEFKGYGRHVLLVKLWFGLACFYLCMWICGRSRTGRVCKKTIP